MKNKRLVKIITVICGLIAIFFIGFLRRSNDIKGDYMSENIVSQDNEPIVVNNIPQDVVVSASYIDGYETIEDLCNEAELIVMGQVKKQWHHEFGLSMISEVDCEKVLFGELKEDKVEVIQLKDGHVLEEGKQYVLFLKEQEEQIENVHQYYVIGYGLQGIFEISGEDILPKDEVMMVEFEGIKEKGELHKSFKSNNDIELLRDFIGKTRELSSKY